MNIHFIAIGGSIMHSLAIELKSNGHHITGSDDVIYDPAKSNLKSHNLLPTQYGWSPKNITTELDMIILGMHAKEDNPELIEAKNKNILILSFPEFIFKYAESKKRIVIAGSHGKTTITGMILHVLHDNNIKTDYLLGAKIDLLDKQVSLSNSNLMIIEGDEYYSSAIDLTPKFMHYNPDILVVSGVSWDHVNVFPTLVSYQNAFKNILQKVIVSSGKIFYCNHDNFLSSFLKTTLSVNSYSLPEYVVEKGKFNLIYNDKKIPLQIFGKHNLYNMQAAKHVCNELGVSDQNFFSSIKKFKGVSRRLTLIKNLNNHSSVYYDFAHSPSKVLATVSAVRELNPDRYLLACFELYTFSSLNIDFIPNYANVFSECDEVWIYIADTTLKLKGLKNINEKFINNAINHQKLLLIKDKSQLSNRLINIQLFKTNLLMMSSGNFSGLNMRSIFK